MQDGKRHIKASSNHEYAKRECIISKDIKLIYVAILEPKYLA